MKNSLLPITLVGVLLFWACGGDDAQDASAPPEETWSGPGELPPDCSGDVLHNRVEASPWASARTGVVAYFYEADLGTGVTTLTLLDAEEGVLGRLEASQVFGDPEVPEGSLVGTLEAASGERIHLRTRGRDVGPDGWTTLMHLETPDAEAWVEAEHRVKRCWEGVDVEEAPPCAAPLRMDGGLFVLPSCGSVADERILEGEAPTLHNLTYLVEESDERMGAQARLRREGTRSLVAFDALAEGVPADEEDLMSWLVGSGADAVLANVDVALLATVWLDRSWWRTLAQHAAWCEVANLPPVEAAPPEGGASDDAIAPIRKRCAGAQDNNAWGSPDNRSGASVWGDPHMVSLNGLAWDLHAAGEFVLLRAHEGEPFEVQGRFEPLQNPPFPACGNITWNTAAATDLAGVRVTARSIPEFEVRVDGELVTLESELPELPEGASLELAPGRVELRWPGGEEVRFVERPSTNVPESSLSVEVSLPESRAGQVRGLLGTADGEVSTDLVMPDGTVLPWPLRFETRHRVLAPAWRVDVDTTLHDYGAGLSADDFWLPSFPGGPALLDDLPAEAVADARAACRDEDIEDPHLLDACALDSICIDLAQGAVAAEAPEPVASLPIGEEDIALEGDIRRYAMDDAPAATPDTPPDTCAPWTPAPLALIRGQGPLELEEGLASALVDTRRHEGDSDDRSTLEAGPDVVAWDLLRRAQDNPDRTQRATIHFSTPVLGVLIDAAPLEASDTPLGATPAAWLALATPASLDGRDALTLSSDRRSLSLRFAGADARRIRILTEAP